MEVKEYKWVLPKNLSELISQYSAKPENIPDGLIEITINIGMGNNYGYTPSNAAMDLQETSNNVIANFEGHVNPLIYERPSEPTA